MVYLSGFTSKVSFFSPLNRIFLLQINVPKLSRAPKILKKTTKYLKRPMFILYTYQVDGSFANVLECLQKELLCVKNVILE